MAYLASTEQTEHDAVVESAAQYLRTGGRFDVYTNPGQEHKTGFKGLYPDIILADKGTSAVRFVVEVETPSSVSRESVAQWKQYSNLGVPFYVLVPIVLVAFAKQLCSEAGVRAALGYYYRDQLGKLQVVYENTK